MKNSEMQTRKILNFLYNDASTQKKRQFEEEIKNNSELKNELELQKEIDKAISNEIKVDSFRDRLNNIHDSHINKREGRILNLQNKWYWAAASITIFSGTAIYSIKNHFQSTDKLYQNYYEKWEPSFVTRGAESEALYKNIADEFEAGNYEKVISLLNKSFQNNSFDPKLLLLKGCAEMELSYYSSAIKTFTSFESKNYTFYTEAGEWYLALCHLKNQDINKSKEILSDIIMRKTSYANEAADLLKKLN